MKKLLLLLPLLALASCSYPSKYEAEAACDEWVNNGRKWIYMRDKEDLPYMMSSQYPRNSQRWRELPKYLEEIRDIRYCQHEHETRQYIGWDNGKKAGQKYYLGTIPDRKIIKRFRY